MRCGTKGFLSVCLFVFKDNIKNLFVFIGIGNQHKGFPEVLARFGVRKDSYKKEGVGMLLSQKSEKR